MSFLVRSPDTSALDPEILKENVPLRNASPNALAQQTTAKDSAFPTGTTVKYKHSSTNKLCQIIPSVQHSNGLSYTIRVLCSKEHHIVQHSDLDALSTHQPSGVPDSHTDINPASLQKCLTREDLSQIWEHSPDSISLDQRLFLYWHQRLDHPTMKTMHKLALIGVIPCRLSKVTKMPPCVACIFAKMQKRRWREAHSKGGSIRDAKDTSPGPGTSCDHIISAQPGLIPQSTGTLTYKRFGGAVLFIDHFSGFQYVHLIQSTTAAETLTAKREYERADHSFGVTIKRYRADNSRFDEKVFQTDCRRLHQDFSYCGVSSHHQNGIAESNIKSSCYSARTLLLHAKRQWPSAINTILWPFALRAAVEKHNRIEINPAGLTPQESFSGIHSLPRAPDHHTWGCPIFVLDSDNHSGLGTPKLEPRSRVGDYLGHSPYHAGNVALVRNLRTGHVSPQFHVIFGDDFSTVPYLDSTESPPNWHTLTMNSRECVTDEQFRLADNWNTTGATPTHEPALPLAPIPPPPETHETSVPSHLPVEITSQRNPSPRPREDSLLQTREVQNTPSLIPLSQTFLDLNSAGLRRSTRKRSHVERLTYGCLAIIMLSLNSLPPATANCYHAVKLSYQDYLEHNFDDTSNLSNPIAQIFQATITDNEVYTMKEMLRQPDKLSFEQAMHTDTGTRNRFRNSSVCTFTN